MSVFDALQSDIYNPSQLKPSLAQANPYQTYTLVCVDRQYSTSDVEYYQKNSLGLLTTFDSSTETTSLVPYSPPQTTNGTNTKLQDNFLAIQTFAPVPIPVNFLDYVNQYYGQ